MGGHGGKGLNKVIRRKMNPEGLQLEFKHYKADPDDPESISNNSIMDLEQRCDGYLWVTTYGGGLNKLVHQDGEEVFKKYLEKGGLPDNTVKYLAEDSAGYFWITTQSGLVRFNPYSQPIGKCESE